MTSATLGVDIENPNAALQSVRELRVRAAPEQHVLAQAAGR